MTSNPTPSMRFRSLKGLGGLALELGLAGLLLWSTLAIYHSPLPPGWFRCVLAALFACGAIAARICIHPSCRARLLLFGASAVIIGWFLITPPSNDRDWQPDVAILPYSEINDNLVTIYNIRNCEYLSEADYTVRHYDKIFDLRQLQTVDLYLVYWGSPLIAHTMLSFGFEGGDYLCFSIETRKEKGESYSAIKGFFRQFELTYVVGDERDLVRLRTSFRGEQVYLYRLQAEIPLARLVFLDYLEHLNQLNKRPEWYNALVSNCTTNIRGHMRPYVRNARFDWRILFNGRIDETAYERGTIHQSLTFAELKARSLINSRATATATDDSDFSRRIRQGLPGVEVRRGSASQTVGVVSRIY